MSASKLLTVADIMTRKIATIFEEEGVEELLGAMERMRFRHLPVVDGGKLVGLLTHRDLLRISGSSADPVASVRDAARLSTLFVRDVMQTGVETASPEMTVAAAAKLMRDAKHGCLPVVEADGTLVGIVTASDFLDLVVRLLGDH